MTNAEMIMEHLEVFGIEFNYNGDNLLTFAQWKQKGMSVKKGEKAFIQLPLWTYKEEVEKDENGKVIMEDGKPKKKKVFYKKMSSLFTAEQVQEAKQPKKKKTTKKKGKAA